ncbi:MAG: magnesium transporter [Anaerolineae bacterium]
MEQDIIEGALAQVRRALQRGDIEGAVAVLSALRLPDRADAFADLELEQQQEILPQFSLPDSADLLEEMEDEEAAELAARLDVGTLVPILDEMEPDEAADLLGDLRPEQVTAALAQMTDPDEVRPLLLHPDETAGGLMTSEFLALRRRMTAAEALTAVRRWAPAAEETGHYLFVVDREGRLCGVVSLLHLIKAPPTALVSDLMDPDVIHVMAGTDQEECARLMARYDIMALPVVDEGRRLLGIITVDDLVEVLEDEATEDIQRLGGAEPLGRPYLDSGVIAVAWKRMGWLLLLFITETFTGSVLRHFQAELNAAVALAFFVPLLIGTGGNAGSQTINTIIRALAVGEIDLRDALRVFWHEIRAGVLLGLIMAAIAFARALTWGATTALALAVATSIFTIVIWANSVGSLLPLLAARLGIDPTVVSGPFMSTLVDATGLFIYFTIAKLILGI